MPYNWLYKIKNFATPPPSGVWKHIANILDKENDINQNDFATKILNYSIPTPANSWNEIATALDENKVRPIYFAKTFYLRIAAAAAVLALITTTVWVYKNKKNDVVTNETTTIAAPQKSNNIILKDTANNNQIQKTESEKKENITAIILPKQKIKKIITILPDYVKGNMVNDLANNPTEFIKEKMQNADGQIPTDIALMNSPNTYISIIGPDGQTVKVSSKFSNLIGYLNNQNADTQENLDIIISESAKWRKIFADWRSKMNSVTVTPSIDNFMDIIELNKLLNDNQ